MKLPELREGDAPPDIAAIYAGLRAGIGVAQVNLIWRHAAALPGVLEWLWAQARPALESGAVAGVRDRIGARIVMPPIPRMAAPAGVFDLAETYNRGNLSNLAVLTAIRRRLEGLAAGAPGPVGAIGAMMPPPPPLPRPTEIPRALYPVITRLTAEHHLSDPAVVPSLYLHLAHWPPVLMALPDALAPLFAEGRLMAVRDAAIAAAEAEAAGLIAALGPAPPEPEALVTFRTSLRVFSRELIPGMVPIGLALAAAIGR